MAAYNMPDAAYLRECFHYDPASGVLTWRKRPRSHFDTDQIMKLWHGKMAMRVAGSPDGRGYLRVGLGRYQYKVHRLAWVLMTGSDPGEMLIDHRDTDGFNNRWKNLRIATHQENQWNKNHYRSSSLPKGIYYRENNLKPYKVQISLGSFATLEEAKAARDAVARSLHGGFYKD